MLGRKTSGGRIFRTFSSRPVRPMSIPASRRWLTRTAASAVSSGSRAARAAARAPASRGRPPSPPLMAATVLLGLTQQRLLGQSPFGDSPCCCGAFELEECGGDLRHLVRREPWRWCFEDALGLHEPIIL